MLATPIVGERVATGAGAALPALRVLAGFTTGIDWGNANGRGKLRVHAVEMNVEAARRCTHGAAGFVARTEAGMVKYRHHQRELGWRKVERGSKALGLGEGERHQRATASAVEPAGGRGMSAAICVRR